jgi:MoaA/NifB/PqqE/SkfB family radical SAM enzyme
LGEADNLGISIVVVAGGEPLTRPDILEVAARHPAIVFPLSTNGLLADAAVVQRLAEARNILAVLSLEGGQAETDERRGHEMYARVLTMMAQLRLHGVLFGTSLTLTRENLEHRSLRDALSSPLLRRIRASGVQLQQGAGGCALFDQRQQVLELSTRAEVSQGP